MAFDFEQPIFVISVAAELAAMHPQTLRMYEARGLIEPKRSPKGTRLYSKRDVERLRRIQELTCELGMNLAGVERVFELEIDGVSRPEPPLREVAPAEPEPDAWEDDLGKRMSERIEASVRRSLEASLGRVASSVDGLADRAAKRPERIAQRLEEES